MIRVGLLLVPWWLLTVIISDVVDIVMPGDAKEQVFKVTDVKLTEADEPVIQVSVQYFVAC